MNKSERIRFLNYCLQGGYQHQLKQYFHLLNKLSQKDKAYQQILQQDRNYITQRAGFLFGTFAKRELNPTIVEQHLAQLYYQLINNKNFVSLFKKATNKNKNFKDTDAYKYQNLLGEFQKCLQDKQYGQQTYQGTFTIQDINVNPTKNTFYMKLLFPYQLLLKYLTPEDQKTFPMDFQRSKYTTNFINSRFLNMKKEFPVTFQGQTFSAYSRNKTKTPEELLNAVLARDPDKAYVLKNLTVQSSAFFFNLLLIPVIQFFCNLKSGIYNCIKNYYQLKKETTDCTTIIPFFTNIPANEEIPNLIHDSTWPVTVFYQLMIEPITLRKMTPVYCSEMKIIKIKITYPDSESLLLKQKNLLLEIEYLDKPYKSSNARLQLYTNQMKKLKS